MTRHQRWILALAATIATIVFLPTSPAHLLGMAIPTLWCAAYVAHRCDILADRLDRTEEHLTGQVDVAVADIVIACKPPPGNQRNSQYRGRGDRPLQSV